MPFSKGINLKVNISVQLEFEPAYFEVIVHHFHHYARGAPPKIKQEFLQVIAMSVLLYGCTTWILKNHLKKILKGNNTLQNSNCTVTYHPSKKDE